MFSIFPTRSVSTIKTSLHIHLNPAIELLSEDVPHAQSWFSVLIVGRGSQDLHFDLHDEGDVGYFSLDVLG